VQGVGFRPFVFRLAQQHGLSGWVQNQLGEVEIIVQGRDSDVDRFQADLTATAPPLARPVIESVTATRCRPLSGFSILTSAATKDPRIFVPPDYFMCPDCLAELTNPADRRYLYPFINCTQCGPRYTLIRAMPYDRPNTSMAQFPLCAECRADYENPEDRRFHAEPLACNDCGPQLELAGDRLAPVTGNDSCLAAAAEVIRDGKILAVKGIGGYHLVCDAANAGAVERLRQRKNRPDKPLAVMFPLGTRDPLQIARQHVVITKDEARALLHPSRPIVLLRKLDGSGLAGNLAPGLAELGCFLPYSPLHYLLLVAVGRPVVATSGNISGEPVLTTSEDAERRLGHVADRFLHHDRPIVRPADDSVVRGIGNRVRPLRIGRGMAPLELEVPLELAYPVLALGGQMKATVALGFGNRVILSPHIGEMDSPRSLSVLQMVAADLQKLYGVEAQHLIADYHPAYTTHRLAAREGLPCSWVLHHYAHASALSMEIPGNAPRIVFTWDGVGLGADNTLWGGECLVGTPGHWQRFASLLPIRPPGGDLAARQPWRSAAAMLWEDGRDWRPAADREGLAYSAWQRQLNCPTTSAAGRLFDGAASLVCGIDDCSYEAQAPMQLEALATPRRRLPDALPLVRQADGTWRSDWRPLLTKLLDTRTPAEHRASDFHAAMARVILDQARLARHETGVERVGLTGGVFQNRILSTMALAWLRSDGFEAWLPDAIPCNDGALSLGQVVEFAAGGGMRHE
jgi:hydrogenase maturation protein HypF